MTDRQKNNFLLSPDVFCQFQNVQNPFLAEAPPRTLLGEFTTLLHTP